jgi:hypothetical protein
MYGTGARAGIKGRRAQYHCSLNFSTCAYSFSILLNRNNKNRGNGKGTECSYVYFLSLLGVNRLLSSIFEGDIWVKRVTLTQLQSHPQHSHTLRSLADTLAAYSTIILMSYRSRCMLYIGMGPKKVYSIAIA